MLATLMLEASCSGVAMVFFWRTNNAETIRSSSGNAASYLPRYLTGDNLYVGSNTNRYFRRRGISGLPPLL